VRQNTSQFRSEMKARDISGLYDDCRQSHKFAVAPCLPVVRRWRLARKELRPSSLSSGIVGLDRELARRKLLYDRGRNLAGPSYKI
jgi:hypothetical protein